MTTARHYTGTIVVVHALIIFAAYSSPFWLAWQLVTVGVAVYYAQLVVVGGCILSRAQFEDKDQSFHEWYLRKLGVAVNRRRLNFMLRCILPGTITLAAILLQVILKAAPVIQL